MAIREANGAASGILINLTKTLVVPLCQQDHAMILASMQELWQGPLPRIVTAAKYFGFWLGPDTGEACWDKPLRTYEQRLHEWNWTELGGHLARSVYQT
jgi:hypothetical protein